MDTLETIAKRVSVRAYTSKQITKDNLNAILQAGMAAPVGSGAYDSLHITIVQNMAILNKIGDAVANMIFKMFGKRMNKNFGAPTMIFISSKPTNMPGIEYANAGCVIENMSIAATSLGIDNIVWAAGAVIVAQNVELQRHLSIPDGYKPLLCISLGYAITPEAPEKHEISVNKVD